MPRETIAEREHKDYLARRRARYAADRAADIEPVEPAPVAKRTKRLAESLGKSDIVARPIVRPSEWQGPDTCPAEHMTVEMETGGSVMHGRHIGGMWKPVGSEQSVHITKWRYIKKS